MTVPALGPNVPKSDGRLTRPLGRLMLRLSGWRVEGAFPDVGQCVLIVAPHTSNWDFVFGLAAKWALGLRVRFIGKHTLFNGPFGAFMRWVGGIPVDRSKPGNILDVVVAEFGREPRLYLAIAPEGTRRRVERWKSGFHRVARGAGVPIVPVAFDWGRRVIAILPLFEPSDSWEADEPKLLALYDRTMARNPEGYWS